MGEQAPSTAPPRTRTFGGANRRISPVNVMIDSYLYASSLSVVLVVLCIVIHYEALNLLKGMSKRFPRHRTSLIVVMLGLFLAHVVEIWVYAAGYYLADQWLALGTLSQASGNWFDYAYYSAMVYTTVGFGDIVPEGALRMMTMSEALSGLSLITWSASFAFLEMRRLWPD